jgi:uncharacterized RDD family membrane protein YckC
MTDMAEMAEGWYTDPAPADPAMPTTMRYWDGKGWTARTRAANRKELAAWREAVAVERHRQAEQHAAYVETYVAEHGTVPPEVAAAASYTPRDVTPDGQLLAGWWQRFGAILVDGLIAGGLSVLFGWSFLHEVWAAYSTYVQLAVDAARTGAQPPAASGLLDAVTGPLVAFLVVSWVVKGVYGIGFLKAFSATPGKMLLWLEVRLRERPGPLPWGTVLARWFMQNLGSVVSVVPLVGLLGSVYSLLDDLWPLWDGQRQALHDKVARTNVVRTR